LKKKLIIFDLDGVLINSIKNMEFAWINTCKKNNLFIPFYKYKKFIGLPLIEILKKLSIDRKYYLSFNKYYNLFSKKKIHKIKINNKTEKILKNLINKKYVLALYTSKNLIRTNLILGSKKNLFKYRLSPKKNIKGKPFPDGINYLIKKSKFLKKDTIFIGDSIFDYYAAKAAKVDYIHANWGYQKIKIQKKFIVNELKDINHYI
jgi:phosphoglycolate phosphatase-like HAD superfamily hydrolase